MKFEFKNLSGHVIGTREGESLSDVVKQEIRNSQESVSHGEDMIWFKVTNVQTGEVSTVTVYITFQATALITPNGEHPFLLSEIIPGGW